MDAIIDRIDQEIIHQAVQRSLESATGSNARQRRTARSASSTVNELAEGDRQERGQERRQGRSEERQDTSGVSGVRVTVPNNDASIHRALSMVRTEVDNLMRSMPGGPPRVSIIVNRQPREELPPRNMRGSRGQRMYASAMASSDARPRAGSLNEARQRMMTSTAARNAVRATGGMAGGMVIDPFGQPIAMFDIMPSGPAEPPPEPEAPIALPSWGKRKRAPAENMPTPAFVCPITHDTMRDPVQAADGHTYERTAIEKWLREHNTSPQTNLPLAHMELTSNHALRQAIDDYHLKHPDLATPSVASPAAPQFASKGGKKKPRGES